jgi:hypothetical protein
MARRVVFARERVHATHLMTQVWLHAAQLGRTTLSWRDC